MNRKQMIEKYRRTLISISANNEIGSGAPDMGVALEMLRYEWEVHAGKIERRDTYAGIPDDFDWVQFGVDYTKML